MGNGLPHWKDGGHRDGGCQLGPWPLGTLRGTLGRKMSILLAGFLDCSWHTAVHATQSKCPGSYRFQSLVCWQIWSCSGKCLPCCKKSCCQSAGGFLGSNPLSPFHTTWNPCWKIPCDSLTWLYGGAFPLVALNGGFLGRHFGGSLRWGWRLHLVWGVVPPLGPRWGPGCYWGRGGRSLQGRFLLRGIPPLDAQQGRCRNIS